MARVARPWAMFAAGVQSDEDQGGTNVSMQSAPAMPNPHDDYGFRVSKQISRQLHSLNKKLHHGGFEPPEYGVEWNSLYAFNSSKRHGGSPEGSIDVALGLFRQAMSQAPARLGQQSASSEEATDILEMIIDAGCPPHLHVVQSDTYCRFAKRYLKPRRLRRVLRMLRKREIKA